MNRAKPNSENLKDSILRCTRCPRLRAHCSKVGREKRRAFKAETYWGKPVPSFGDPSAKILIVGLAPAAHGANRTGRMFTGDNSGLWLYRALYKAGLSNQPLSESKDDSLVLKKVLITAAAHCAPPDNKPTPQELANCSGFLKTEIIALQVKGTLRGILVLGKIAFDSVWKILEEQGQTAGVKKPKFQHGLGIELHGTEFQEDSTPKLTILLSYHPSQQNTFTKRLTEPMFDSVFEMASSLI